MNITNKKNFNKKKHILFMEINLLKFNHEIVQHL